MKAKVTASGRRKKVEIDDEYEFLSLEDDSCITRTAMSVNGRVRVYEMVPGDEDGGDAEAWLKLNESTVERVFKKSYKYLVKGRMVLRAWFIKRDHATNQVLRRVLLYVSSLAADFINDFEHWYQQHIAAIVRNLNNLTRRDSDLEFDGIEALEIKFNLIDAVSGRGVFQLPPG